MRPSEGTQCAQHNRDTWYVLHRGSKTPCQNDLFISAFSLFSYFRRGKNNSRKHCGRLHKCIVNNKRTRKKICKQTQHHLQEEGISPAQSIHHANGSKQMFWGDALSLIGWLHYVYKPLIARGDIHPMTSLLALGITHTINHLDFTPPRWQITRRLCATTPPKKHLPPMHAIGDTDKRRKKESRSRCDIRTTRTCSTYPSGFVSENLRTFQSGSERHHAKHGGFGRRLKLNVGARYG